MMKNINEQSGWDLLKSGEVVIEPVKSTPVKDTPKSDNQSTSVTKVKPKIPTPKKTVDLDVLLDNEPNPVNKVGKLVRSSRASRDWVNPDLIRDLEIATKNAKVGNVEITYAQTGHSQHVKGKDVVSRHWRGAGVDISRINGIGYGNPKMFTTLGNIFVRELRKLGYEFGESGNQKGYLWQTMAGGNHYNHIHVSNLSQTKDPEELKKITDRGIGDTQLKYHKIITSAYEDMLNVITIKPDIYFKNYSGYLNDNEEGAAKWLTAAFNSEYDKNFKQFYKNAHPTDQKNIDNLRRVVKHVNTLILTKKTGTIDVKFRYYDKTKLTWKTQNIQFKWNYL